MRSLWKGAVSFGLVHIPIKLYTATKREDVSFNQLHGACGSRIRYKRFCPHCDVEVTQSDIVRGYEYNKGSYVLVSDDEMEQLPAAAAKTIEIRQFVRLEEIDPVFFDTTYYVEPAEGGNKAYALLREALLTTGRIAIASVVLRTKSSLCALRAVRGTTVNGDPSGSAVSAPNGAGEPVAVNGSRPLSTSGAGGSPQSGGVLIMETMFFPNEIRSPAALSGLDAHPPLRSDELTMAVQIIENLSKPFTPADYVDEYREALLELINDKIRGEQIARAPEAPPSEKVADLMEALRASLKATNGLQTTPTASPPGPATPGPGAAGSLSQPIGSRSERPPG